MPRFFLTLCLCFAVFYGHPAVSHGNACARYISHHEQLKKIPQNLLAAISKVESGKKDGKTQEIQAWPWTINVQGQGTFFSTKTQAINAVRKLLAKGIKSIDVGCMQVNLHHHKDAFKTLEQAFDPKHNVDYAARFLSNLRETHGSWMSAVAHYHSARPVHHIPYKKKVLKKWRQENQENRKKTLGLRGAFWAKDRSLPEKSFSYAAGRGMKSSLMMSSLRARIPNQGMERMRRTSLVTGTPSKSVEFQRSQERSPQKPVRKKPAIYARKMVLPGY